MAYTDGTKSGGRKKGTPNRVTRAVKDALMQSFDEVGGVVYLNRLAEIDPKAYSTLLGKVIPAELQATVQGSMDITICSGIDSSPGSDSEADG